MLMPLSIQYLSHLSVLTICDSDSADNVTISFLFVGHIFLFLVPFCNLIVYKKNYKLFLVYISFLCVVIRILSSFKDIVK